MAAAAEIPYVFESAGRQIVGMMHRPASPGGTAVLMCHGFTGHKGENVRIFVDTAREFSDNGYHVERFDFFGSGDSAGHFHESRISLNIQNLRDALVHIRQSGAERIVILGLSMGAATAILTARDLDLAGLILWSPVPDMKTLLLSKIDARPEDVAGLDSFEYGGWLIERAFYQDAIQYDIIAAFSEITIPKLIVQGSHDDPVFTQGFKEFKRAAAGESRFEMLATAGHTFETVSHRRQVIAMSRDWLISHFG